jgi:glutamate dehydrogenase
LAVSEPAPSEPAASEPTASEPAASEPAASEPAVSDAPRGWVGGLTAVLEQAGRRDAREVAEAFASRLPSSYFERTTPDVAAFDLVQLESLKSLAKTSGASALRMAVQPDPDPGAGMLRLRLYGRKGVELSDFLPVLESFGLIVVEAVPHRIEADEAGVADLHLDDFGLRAQWGLDPLVDGDRVVEAIQASWRGAADVDSLNRLVLCARMTWRDVVVLRAYRRYRRQAGTTWSDRQLDDALVAFPAVARALLNYFDARFNPAAGGAAGSGVGSGVGSGDSRFRGEKSTSGGGLLSAESGGADRLEPDAHEAAARAAVLKAAAAVERLEQDQVLRGYLSLIDATVRTNRYTSDPDPAVLVLKLDSTRVPDLPPPRPYVETFVYSPVVEGLHLRAGRIARGGIRWSERGNDLRTEVLGLVRAQVLKNAGIVPTGAKGGFFCKRLGPDLPPGDAEAELEACYQIFIEGLLSVTDNVVGGRVVTPPGVRPADGEDPYLVVAPDRGTAAFSDLANRISASYRFWLGDAFASGGTHGYDHKAMGITARGAWVVAQQHFRQLGIDAETEPIRVVGIGDLSGDVFGNGMLRSRSMRLLAAFDHRDVFIDPSPDPARSFDERKRLFSLPHSTWQDYDRALISAGGGVWSREVKQIPVSPQVRSLLGFSEATESVRPPELVRAILAAPADLMWLGGIGTFVKAVNESDADVGDQANDAVRLTADQVNARVVAEGANLGYTQRARIAYSRRGGKINTDFIDNAGGVATSDREVNLKILLALATERGRLLADQRDELLESVRDEVAAAVLRQVGLSAFAVTLAVPASAADIDAYEALMAGLELAGHLDRKVEALPDAEEIGLRRIAGAGLTRPEAAVLFAYAKADLADALEVSPLATDPEVGSAVASYFPPVVTARFGDLLTHHRLYPQLAATEVAGELVDRMGITWAHETADELGVGLAATARAYWAARLVIDADRRWRQVESLASSVSADAESALHHSVGYAVGAVARSYLVDGAEDAGWLVAHDGPVAARFEAELELERVPATESVTATIDALVGLGVDRQVAGSFGRLERLAGVADIAAAARETGRSVREVVAAFDQVDRALGLTSFQARLAGIHVNGRWERWAARSLLDDVNRLRREAVVRGFDAAAAGGRPSRFDRLAGQVDGSSGQALAVAALAVRALAELVGSANGREGR